MPPVPSDAERDLNLFEADLKRLEAEYNMFFAGRLPRPPWETRSRVEAMAKRLDREPSSNYGNRFRFNALQSRLSTFIDLWDRGLRAREEGRPGPFAQPRSKEVQRPKPLEDRILNVTTFRDPMREIDKLRELYNSLSEVRRESGAESIPFHKFAELVKTQVDSMKEKGSPEVAFRVAVKEGKLNFTARALKGMKG